MGANNTPEPGWSESLGSEADNPPEPRTSGEKIHALGKEWTVSSLEFGIRAQYEQWVRSTAAKSIEEIETELGAEAGAAARSTYMADRGAGVYNWDGRAVRTARTDIPGILHLLYLLLKRCHPDITPEVVEAIFRDAPRSCALAVGWAQGNSKTPPITDVAAGDPLEASDKGKEPEIRMTKAEILSLIREAKKTEKEPMTFDSLTG